MHSAEFIFPCHTFWTKMILIYQTSWSNAFRIKALFGNALIYFNELRKVIPLWSRVEHTPKGDNKLDISFSFIEYATFDLSISCCSYCINNICIWRITKRYRRIEYSKILLIVQTCLLWKLDKPLVVKRFTVYSLN